MAQCKATANDLDLFDQIDFHVGDARTLRGIPRKAFDAVLPMGPLYHLVLKTDRLVALRSAYACLKSGRVIFSALVSRLGILGYLTRDNPLWIESRKSVWSHIRNGHRSPDAPPGGFCGYFARLDEIAPMHEAVGFHTAQIAGVEPAISADDESFNRLEGSQRDLWLDLLFDVSADQCMVALSRHIVYIGYKPAA